jgi:hypothetical protein
LVTGTHPSINRHGGGRHRRWDRRTTPLPVDGVADHKAMLSMEQEAHIVVMGTVVVFNNSNCRI